MFTLTNRNYLFPPHEVPDPGGQNVNKLSTKVTVHFNVGGFAKSH